MTAYTTSFVFSFGVSGIGKLYFSISTCNTSSNVCPGFCLVFNFLKCSHIFFISSLSCNGTLVLCRFYLYWCKCPRVIAIGVSKCFWTNSCVMSGHVPKKLFLIAISNIDLTGEKHVAYSYCINSWCVWFFFIMTANDWVFTSILALRYYVALVLIVWSFKRLYSKLWSVNYWNFLNSSLNILMLVCDFTAWLIVDLGFEVIPGG